MAIDQYSWAIIRGDPRSQAALAATFNAERKNRKLSRAQVCKLAGRAGQKAVDRLEQGRLSALSFEMITSLARAIGLSVDDLVDRAAVPSSALTQGLPPKPAFVSFLERQRSALLNAALLPGIHDADLSLRFLWPELIVDSPLLFRRTPRSLNLKDWGPTAHFRRIALIGAAGGGKSTSLRYVALTNTDALLAGENVPLPYFMHMRDALEAGSEEEAWTAKRSALRIPLTVPLLYLIDGADEVAEHVRGAAVHAVLSRIPSHDYVIVSCRSGVFEDIARNSKLSEHVDEIVEILAWDFDEHVLPFAKAYCERQRRPDDYATLAASCKEMPHLRAFVSNPFHLTIVLFILRAGTPLTDELFLSRYRVYREFYRCWLTREAGRGTSDARGHKIFELHKLLASALFQNKPNGVLVEETGDLLTPYVDVLGDSAFRDLLLIMRDPALGNTKIESFRHETLLEYFLAEGIMSCLRKGERTDEILAVEYTSDVNAFVREAIDQLTPQQRSVIATQLSNSYEHYLRPPLPNETATRVREQLIYYAGRLGLDQCPAVLEGCYRNDPDRVTRRAAALGAILHGREDLEEDYIRQLMTDPDEDELNRSIQLVYFGDIDGSIHSFKDTGKSGWARTREAIMKRLASNSTRDVRLRRWDLATLRSFLQSRPMDSLYADDLRVLAATQCANPGQTPARSAALEEQRDELLRLWP